jgi:hypothetical protein
MLEHIRANAAERAYRAIVIRSESANRAVEGRSRAGREKEKKV